MSERMTGVNGPNHQFGLEEWGRRTRAEMVAEYRRYWTQQRAQAERALAVPDEELVVSTYLGTHAQKNREVVS